MVEHICVNSEISNDNEPDSHPLISVVIPVYNVEKYLRECVESVINQTYPLTEIILIDDGSMDSSGSICDEFMSIDFRIKVIHQENHGLGYTRNVGMKKATGKYIIFLDSDDYWRLNTLEELLDESEKNNLQVIAFSAHSFCDGIDYYNGPSYSHSVQNNVVKNGAESLQFAMSRGEYYVQACLRFYRLDYLRDNGFHFDEGIIHEDESFSFLAYIHAERVECVGEKYYYRRYRPGSIMMTKEPFQSAHGYRVAIDTLLKYMQKKSLGPLESELYCRQIKGYISVIYALNKDLLEKKAKSSALGRDVYSISIANDVRDTFRKACREMKGISFLNRAELYHFGVGYHMWLMRQKRYRLRERLSKLKKVVIHKLLVKDTDEDA